MKYKIHNLLANSIIYLEKLIAINTVSNLSNLAKICYIESILKPLGYRCIRDYNKAKDKANLWASIGKQEKPGIVLSGHTDVVPIEGQKWSKPAFALTQNQGKLYGRGTCDMQSSLALILAFAPFYKDFSIPVHLCFTYDEEIGCLGIRNLLKTLPKICPRLPKMCFIGEPTEFFPIIAHKGRTICSLIIQGLSCHSAYPTKGVNAIFYAIEFINFFKKLSMANEQYQDKAFSVPYSTFNIGVIKGGTSLNILPKTCQVNFEIRAIDEQKNKQNIKQIINFVTEINKELQAKHSFCSAKLTVDNYPSFAISENTEIFKLACQFSENKISKKASYATEASAFQEIGIPTIVIGGGNVAQAHKPDEYIELSQLEKGVQFFNKMHQHFSSN